MQVTLVRHATLMIEYAGIRILLDPMLSKAKEMAPIDNSPNQQPNPLVDLPANFDVDAVINVDAVVVTHVHRDHLDAEAIARLPKDMPVFCQPEDYRFLVDHGFLDVRVVERSVEWRDVTLTRTSGRHGTGEIGQRMGAVSGFVFQAVAEPVLYVAGDTIYCQEVEDAMTTFAPDVTVVNTGAAQFLVGDPITMTADDVMQLRRNFPLGKLMAVHMESINHCLLTRASLFEQLQAARLMEGVWIPSDGETMAFSL